MSRGERGHLDICAAPLYCNNERVIVANNIDESCGSCSNKSFAGWQSNQVCSRSESVIGGCRLLHFLTSYLFVAFAPSYYLYIMTIDMYEQNTPTASTSDTMQLTVSHAGRQHLVSIAASATLAELQDQLYRQTSVAPTAQKLVFKGKTLSSSANSGSSLSSLGLSAGSKVLMIGSKDATVSAFVKQGEDMQRRAEILKTRATIKPRNTPSHGKQVMDLNDLRRSGVNAYGRIEVLPHCPHEDLRRERLVRLSKDEAVLSEHLIQSVPSESKLHG
jgi:hypothetical protein